MKDDDKWDNPNQSKLERSRQNAWEQLWTHSLDDGKANLKEQPMDLIYMRCSEEVECE